MEFGNESAAARQLAEAIIRFHQPKLERAEDELKDLTVKQDLLLSELQKQNKRLDDAVGQSRVQEMIGQTRMYHEKLVYLKKEMDNINDRVQRLKRRALKLQQQKQQEVLLKEQAKDRELEREKQLIARPAKRN